MRLYWRLLHLEIDLLGYHGGSSIHLSSAPGEAVMKLMEKLLVRGGNLAKVQEQSVLGLREVRYSAALGLGKTLAAQVVVVLSFVELISYVGWVLDRLTISRCRGRSRFVQLRRQLRQRSKHSPRRLLPGRGKRLT
jgi:hypothetical protein